MEHLGLDSVLPALQMMVLPIMPQYQAPILTFINSNYRSNISKGNCTSELSINIDDRFRSIVQEFFKISRLPQQVAENLETSGHLVMQLLLSALVNTL